MLTVLGPFAFWLAIGCVVAAVVLGYRRAQAAKIAKARAMAARYGFDVDPGHKGPPAQKFDLFGRGDSRKVSFQFWRPGRQDSVFAYQYSTGSGKNRTTYHHTCALIALPFAAPHTKIGPEGFWSGIGKKLGIRDIEVESPGFNERYRVNGDDERFAVTMLDGRAIDWFMRDQGTHGVRFEWWGSWLLCITDEMEMERYFGFHDWAAGIPAHLPDVLTSLYPVRTR